MSYFDPQSLYVHRQRSTKRGQIIQKKPQPHVSATSPNDIPFAKSVLLNQGYKIYPPDDPPRISTYEAIYQPFSYPNIVPTQTKTVTFNTIWNSYKNYFQSLIDIPDSSLTGSSYVTINITSIYVRFQGSLTSNDQISINYEEHQSLNYTSQHVSNNSYYTIIPFSASQCSIAKTTSTGGSTSNSSYSIQIAQGLLSQISSLNTWSELKSDSGLSVDKQIINFSSNHVSNYVSEIRVNGFISCSVGVYAI